MKRVLRVPDGHEVHYEVRPGRKRALVFLPPLFFEYDFWYKSIDYFHARGHTTIGITLRGHSAKRIRQFTLKDHISDVARVLDNEAVKEPVLVGLSIGGTVAAAYAHAHRVAACVCFNPPLDSAAKTVFPRVNSLSHLGMMLAAIDYFPKIPSLDLVHGSYKNQLVFNAKIFLKYNASGPKANYLILKELRPISRKGIITVVSDDDEVVMHTYEPTHRVPGRHWVALDNPILANKIISGVLAKLGKK